MIISASQCIPCESTAFMIKNGAEKSAQPIQGESLTTLQETG